MELLHLDRRLLLLLAASLMPACIIPIGPDWQDPPGEENQAPRFIATTPESGMHFGADRIARFTITVSDPNVGQTLFLKWLAEYPPYVTDVTRPLVPRMTMVMPSGTGGAARQPVTEEFDCNAINSKLSSHLITAAVSDSPFLIGGPSGQPLLVEDNGQTDTVNWTLTLTCPMPSP